MRNYRRKYPQRVKDQMEKYRSSPEVQQREKDYYRKNKTRIAKRHKQWAKKQRLELIKLLGGKCIWCGESDWRCLQIDHVHGGGRKERKKFKGSTTSYYSFVIKQIKAGSKDYQLLCANCNWKKKYENEEV